MAFASPEANVAAIGLMPGLKVADFGAGSGRYALALSKAVAPGEVYAVDIQKDLLSRLEQEAKRAYLENLHFVWGDVEQVGGSKLPEQSVDVVLMSNLLFQLTGGGYSAALEAKRVLRLGGRLVIIDWQESFGGLGPTQGQVVNAEKAKAIIEPAGFTLDHDFPAGEHHYGLIFKSV